MALLGTFVDRAQNQSMATGNPGAEFTTVAHSLPTTPDAVIPVAKSIAAGTNTPVPLSALGNASLSTIGAFCGTVAGQSARQTIVMDVYSIFWHSKVR